MRWLLFLSRLAFLCNLFFLLALSLQFIRWFQNQDVEAFVIIIGYFMAALLNPLTVACYAVFFFINRMLVNAVPRWLLLANIVFFILQLFYLFNLHGTQHP